MYKVYNSDPVVVSTGSTSGDSTGKTIGYVTSCAIDIDRFLTGQAYIETAYAREGTAIGVYQGGVMDRPATAAKVVSRFPKG